MLFSTLAISAFGTVALALPPSRTTFVPKYKRDIEIPIAEHSIPLTRRALPADATLAKRQLLHGNARAYMHAVDMTIGDVPVQLYLDTGSSNIWIIENGFQCLDASFKPVDNAKCNFKPSNFDPATASGSKIDPSYFHTGYAGGEFMYGYGWTADVSFNDITVTDQLVGIVKTAHWAGDGVTSGLIGLGSLFTNQIYRNDSNIPEAGDKTRIVFPNPITSAWQQGLSDEYHTLALNRVPFDDEHNGVQPAGYLSLGGRPADIAVTGNQVTIPLIRWTVGANGAFINEQAWSAFDVKATFEFPGSDQVQQAGYGLEMDTGSVSVGLPTPVYNAYRALVNSTACDGSGLPDLTLVIDGVKLAFDRRDLLNYNDGSCYLDIYDNGDSKAALGPNYAQNAVFSWNKKTGEVTIMERAPY